MQLYSYNNQYPTKLPNRLKFPDGTTRTDSSTFTDEEIAAAGWVAVDNPPEVQHPNVLEWKGTEWVVREPNNIEVHNQWKNIKEACLRRLEATDYKVIKAMESGVAVDPAIVSYRQALRDLYNNVNDVDPWTVEFPSMHIDEEQE